MGSGDLCIIFHTSGKSCYYEGRKQEHAGGAQKVFPVHNEDKVYPVKEAGSSTVEALEGIANKRNGVIRDRWVLPYHEIFVPGIFYSGNNISAVIFPWL